MQKLDKCNEKWTRVIQLLHEDLYLFYTSMKIYTEIGIEKRQVFKLTQCINIAN